jgi:addiction module HigA family antidote
MYDPLLPRQETQKLVDKVPSKKFQAIERQAHKKLVMPAKTKKYPPIHPGEILKDILSEARLSASAAALKMRIPSNRLTAILNGSRSITADTALRLAALFGNSSQMWMNLQSNYDLDLAEYESGERIRREVEALRLAS